MSIQFKLFKVCVLIFNISVNYKENIKLKDTTKFKSIFEDADKRIVELLNIIKSYGTR